MTGEDGDGSHIHERETARRVQAALTEMQNQRRDFQHSRVLGQLDTSVHLQFQAACIDLAERLRPFRSQTDNWEEVAGFSREIGTVTEDRTVESGLRRYQTQTFERPRLLEPERLLNISRWLDEIASDIGVEPAPETVDTGIDGGIAR